MKPKNQGPEYSRARHKEGGSVHDLWRKREWQVILEDLRGQFRTFGEGMEDVRHRLHRIEEQVSRIPMIEVRLASIESAFRPITQQVSEHEKRLNGHEKRLVTLDSR